jgi:hypothetical protein
MLQTITSNESYIFLAVFTALALIAFIYLLSPMSLADEPLIYLIGVNHAVQFKAAISQIMGEPKSVQKKREAFKMHVAEMIDKLDIEVLAEEFSDEGKKESRAREFAKDFAKAVHEPFDWETARQQFDWETELQKFNKARGIEHRLCDPNSIEKQALGIEVDPEKETESDWRKREQVWLSRIADCKDRRVLFVCGDNHYDAFAQLLESNGFNVRRGPHYDVSNEEFDDLERTSADV